MTNDNVWRWANAYDDRKVHKAKRNGGTEMTHDKLDQIFEMQAQLDNRIIRERNIEKSLDEWVIGITLAMESEIDEIRREVNWKWWKNEKPIDLKALQGEVIDMWHFLVSLSQKVGLTPEDVYRVYCEKNAENHARQDGKSDKEGYDVSGVGGEK
jgi:dimeric dUTPase (all-alpha-NTP-PPase superfamily)